MVPVITGYKNAFTKTARTWSLRVSTHKEFSGASQYMFGK